MTDDCLRRMVRIPAGEFLMGMEGADDDERPVHPVFVDEFYLASHPVTNAEYFRFVSETGYRPAGIYEMPSIACGHYEHEFAQLAARYVWKEGRPPEGLEHHPVTLVQHRDAVEYSRWLAAVTGRPFRLPTEAEWEKAARGGLEGQRYPWGDDIDPTRANYLPDISLKSRRGTRPVGTYPCNGYRLFDMAGNVWQWVADWYDAGYYSMSEYRNPQGPPTGRMRSVRGGSWVNDDVSLLCCAHRHEVPPDTYAYSIGFRLAHSSA
ncbi:MAG: formylglycine-generating enzyme family protein [Bacteroidales bacterium]